MDRSAGSVAQLAPARRPFRAVSLSLSHSRRQSPSLTRTQGGSLPLSHALKAAVLSHTHSRRQSRRRTDTAAARTVQAARSCRPRPAAQRYRRSRLSWRSNRLKRSVALRAAAGSLTPNGRAGLSGTASRLGPADWPQLALQTTSRRWPARWPAGLPGSACRRSAAGRWRGSNGTLR